MKEIRKLDDKSLKILLHKHNSKITSLCRKADRLQHQIEKQIDKMTEDLDRLSDEVGRRRYQLHDKNFK